MCENPQEDIDVGKAADDAGKNTVLKKLFVEVGYMR